MAHSSCAVLVYIVNISFFQKIISVPFYVIMYVGVQSLFSFSKILLTLYVILAFWAVVLNVGLIRTSTYILYNYILDCTL